MLKLIVGLGNPGATYAQTRHNAGFWLVQQISDTHQITLNHDKKFHGHIGRGTIAGTDIRLLLPDTFMNKSGLAVAAVARFYGITPDEILVAHDELDIKAGLIKLKTGGGHGGHNGLRDITAQLGANFHRLRIGIGRPAHASQVSSFVLSVATNDERVMIDNAIAHTINHLPMMMDNLEKARNHINSFNPPTT